MPYDPTAFDNMKVVLDGAAYDLDMSGEAVIKGRKDLIDLASMSRTFIIRIALTHFSNVSAGIRVNSTLEHLAAELLPPAGHLNQGAYVTIEFSWRVIQNQASSYIPAIKQLWGPERMYEEIEKVSSQEGAKNAIIVSFNRLFTEAMMDDLLDLLHHVVKTLQKLE
jgi:hypothetical protein